MTGFHTVRDYCGLGVILKLKFSRFYGLFDVVWMLEPNGFMFVKGP